jgi:hypothetical protein
VSGITREGEEEGAVDFEVDAQVGLESGHPPCSTSPMMVVLSFV